MMAARLTRFESLFYLKYNKGILLRKKFHVNRGQANHYDTVTSDSDSAHWYRSMYATLTLWH